VWAFAAFRERDVALAVSKAAPQPS
jgi:hypothetical protein